jgi:hypothetical protein
MSELRQETIDAVVAGTLDDSLSQEALDKFIATASIYDEPFASYELSLHRWLRIEDAPDRLEIMHRMPFGEVEDAVAAGFTEEKYHILMEQGCLLDDDYSKALKYWANECFRNEDEEKYFFVWYLLASLHEMESIDGRKCLVLLALTEGGQGGWEFEDVFYGCYKSTDDALAYLQKRGVADPYTDQDLEQYIARAVSLRS